MVIEWNCPQSPHTSQAKHMRSMDPDFFFFQTPCILTRPDALVIHSAHVFTLSCFAVIFSCGLSVQFVDALKQAAGVLETEHVYPGHNLTLWKQCCRIRMQFTVKPNMPSLLHTCILNRSLTLMKKKRGYDFGLFSQATILCTINNFVHISISYQYCRVLLSMVWSAGI